MFVQRSAPTMYDQHAKFDAAIRPVTILLPVFNDWEALAQLLRRLDDVLSENSLRADVLIVNDDSSAPPDSVQLRRSYIALRNIEILNLLRNLGHQRAIAIGLAHLHRHSDCPAVIVMDSDGEDDPRDVPRLLARFDEHRGRKIVFAERRKRSESRLFRVFYWLFCLLHLVLTGRRVRVGNFSVIPRARLESLVVVAELWNHYAAAAIKSRQPYVMTPTQRAKRICGRSKMNFIGLVMHGLSAISVYADIVGVRLLVVSCLLVLLAVSGLASIFAVRMFTALAIPGWATTAAGLLMVVLLQAIMFCVVFSFVVLGSRNQATFLPRRDFAYFVRDLQLIYSATAQEAKIPIESREPAGDETIPPRPIDDESDYESRIAEEILSSIGEIRGEHGRGPQPTPTHGEPAS